MSEGIASIDFETRSDVDLRKAGVYRYAESPHTGVWCFAWRIDEEEPQLWTPFLPDPHRLLKHIAAGGIVVAHNAGFERNIWNTKMPPHWPRIRIEQQQCTMARALALGLPADLDTLGQVIDNKNRKDKEGHALMMKMSKPRGRNPRGEFVWWDELEKQQRLGAYCLQDVRTEREVSHALPPLTTKEQSVWVLDQKINDRGVPIDRRMVERASELADYAKKATDREIRRLTKGAVGRGSQVQRIVTYLNDCGVSCNSFTKADYETLLFQSEVLNDPIIADIVRLRKAASKTSTAKYKAILACLCNDSRVRGLLAFHGARTGRWAGRLVQPQNLHRFDHENEKEVLMLTWLIELLESDLPISEVYDMLYFIYSDVLGPLSKAVRPAIRAPAGRKLIGGDYSNIEGRINAWLAGEAWKVQAFFDYDAKTGPDLYKLAYAKSFGVPVDSVSKQQRQVGKVQELALGYQGSVGAFITMGANPHELAKAVLAAVSSKVWDDIAVKYKRERNKHGLEEKEWTALKILVKQWRNAHPNVVQSWWDYQDAALAAVSAPGLIYECVRGRVKYMSDGNYLYCQIPSGRVIAYAKPEVRTKSEEYEVLGPDGSVIVRERIRNSVVFWGLDSETKKWCEQWLYGGLQCENIVQAIARDIMVRGMFAVEEAGYPIILTVHDELVAEVPKSFGSPQHFAQLMTTKDPWVEGLPLAAAAWEDERYVK